MQSIIQKIAETHAFELISVTPLVGGDINEVFLLKTPSAQFVVKINFTKRYPGMFETEKAGLELLQNTAIFRIPKVIGCGVVENMSYLLMEHIESGERIKGFWSDFGSRLANLHRQSSEQHGLHFNNYIGSLPQSNSFKSTASEFYISERLEPQFKLARQQGYLNTDHDAFYKVVSEVIPNDPPSLLHGDLWNGNYLIDEKHQPVLIDPAVSYFHREMDLAMMQLFGGFPEEVYSTYHENFPLTPEWKGRVPLWQLYYLLVHLNLFGKGYLGQVQSSMAQYS